LYTEVGPIQPHGGQIGCEGIKKGLSPLAGSFLLGSCVVLVYFVRHSCLAIARLCLPSYVLDTVAA
jgi:hypothetical protein